MESADIRVILLHFMQNADQIQLRKSGISMILNGLINVLSIRGRNARRKGGGAEERNGSPKALRLDGGS